MILNYNPSWFFEYINAIFMFYIVFFFDKCDGGMIPQDKSNFRDNK